VALTPQDGLATIALDWERGYGMIADLIYKNVHLLGIFMILVASGGLILHEINGGGQQQSGRKLAAITHGVGMLLVLFSGFGMLARSGIFWPWPGWVTGKVIIWIVFGALIAVIGRTSRFARPLWWIIIVLGGVAAYLALNKPF
jgi:hypothetical protein